MLSWDEFYNEDAPVKKEEQKQPEPRVAEATQAEAAPQEKAVEQTTQEPLVTEDVSSPAMQNVENYTTMKNPTEAELQKVREFKSSSYVRKSQIQRLTAAAIHIVKAR